MFGERRTPTATHRSPSTTQRHHIQPTSATIFNRRQHIWASTTPIPDDPEHNQTAASIVERNQAAAVLMTKHGITTDDLFAAITPHLAEMQNPNDVHFNAKGYDFLGEAVAKAIEAAVK